MTNVKRMRQMDGLLDLPTDKFEKLFTLLDIKFPETVVEDKRYIIEINGHRYLCHALRHALGMRIWVQEYKSLFPGGPDDLPMTVFNVINNTYEENGLKDVQVEADSLKIDGIDSSVDLIDLLASDNLKWEELSRVMGEP